MWHSHEVTTAQSRFFAEHGKYVVANGQIYFEDGAIAEASSMGTGRLQEPRCFGPFELASNICRFRSINAQKAQDEFNSYKRYLKGGDGRGVDGVVTQDQQIAYLEKLRRRVQTAKRHLRTAKAKVEASTTDEIRKHRSADLRQALERQRFLDKVDRIQV